MIAGKKNSLVALVLLAGLSFDTVSVSSTCILNDLEPDPAALMHSFILSSCLCKKVCTCKTKV